jgi:hypothetical protein
LPGALGPDDRRRARRWIGLGTAALLAAGATITQRAVEKPAAHALPWRDEATVVATPTPVIPTMTTEPETVDVLIDAHGREYESLGGGLSI